VNQDALGCGDEVSGEEVIEKGEGFRLGSSVVDLLEDGEKNEVVSIMHVTSDERGMLEETRGLSDDSEGVQTDKSLEDGLFQRRKASA
jgi:hypothetical protein